MIRLKYVGRKKAHSDSLYNTRTTWFGQDDVQEIEDDAKARLMAKNHPDVYKVVEPGVNERDETVRKVVRENTNPLAGIIVDEVDGTQIPIEDATHKAVVAYVEKEYGLYIEDSATKVELLAHLEKLLELKKDFASVPAADEALDPELLGAKPGGLGLADVQEIKNGLLEQPDPEETEASEEIPAEEAPKPELRSDIVEIPESEVW